MFRVYALGLSVLSVVSAAVVPRQSSITSLSSAQINAFTPYTNFASAAYCSPSTTINWSCGANCNANPGFIPVASGGDVADVEFWFVGFDPALNQVIMAHRGVDTSNIIAYFEFVDFSFTNLDPTLFPGISTRIKVHNGFEAQQARSARDILAAVQTAMSTHGTTSVTVVGHSLGAAIGLIDAVYLHLHLPSTTTFKLVGYGMPRVGNSAFAEYLDAHFPDLTRINNKEDPVPVLPSVVLGFHDPHGEIHISDNGEWDSCSGDDNPSELCSDGAVQDIFQSHPGDNVGPYNGITMGC